MFVSPACVRACAAECGRLSANLNDTPDWTCGTRSEDRDFEKARAFYEKCAPFCDAELRFAE